MLSLIMYYSIESVVINLKRYGWIIKKYIYPARFAIAGLFGLLITGILCELALPKLAGYCLDQNIDSSRVLFLLPIFYIGLALLRAFVQVINAYFSERLSWKAANKMREDIFRHVMGLDINFHKSTTVGELIERIDGDVSFLADFFTMFFGYFLGNLLLIAGILIMFFTIHPLLGCTFTVLTLLILLLFILTNHKVTELIRNAREAQTETYSFLEEHLTGVEDIRGIGAQEYVGNQLNSVLQQYKKREVKSAFIGNLPVTGFFSLLNVGDAIAIAIGVFLYYTSDMSIGMIYTLISYVSLLSEPMWILRSQIGNYQKISVALRRITQLFEMQSTIITGNTQLSLEKPFSVSVKDISFAYSEEHPVLQNISVEIPAGGSIGLVGKTGSGKTTLLHLLADLMQTDQGCIEINGTPIQDLDRDRYYEGLFYLNQNINLMEGTVRDNLLDFTQEKSDEELMEILKDFELLDWFQTLEHGLDTQVILQNLSAGQSQILALAKLGVKKPRLLLLDEATSYIDPQTELFLQKALHKTMQECTSVIVAHKLSTLDLVDKILVLQNGHITCVGSREDFSDEVLKELLDNHDTVLS